MKIKLISLLLFFSVKCFSQEFNMGSNLGLMLSAFNHNHGYYSFSSNLYPYLGLTFEYKPFKQISFNTDPSITIDDDKLLFTTPLYVKLIKGEKNKFCPNLGIFGRSNRNLGLKYGLHLEFLLKNNAVLIFTGDYYTEFIKIAVKTTQYLNSVVSIPSTTFVFTVGYKVNILKSNKKQ